VYRHSAKCEVCAAQARESSENEERSSRGMGRSVQGQKWKWFGEESVDTRTARRSPNFRSFAKLTWGMSSSRGPSKCPDPVDVEQAAEVK